MLAHPSVPWQDAAISIATHKANVYIDLSGWSPKYFPPQLVRAANGLLKRKVLFGSDYPVITPDRWLADFAALDIKPEVRPLIAEGQRGPAARAAGRRADRARLRARQLAARGGPGSTARPSALRQDGRDADLRRAWPTGSTGWPPVLARPGRRARRPGRLPRPQRHRRVRDLLRHRPPRRDLRAAEHPADRGRTDASCSTTARRPVLVHGPDTPPSCRPVRSASAGDGVDRRSAAGLPRRADRDRAGRGGRDWRRHGCRPGRRRRSSSTPAARPGVPRAPCSRHANLTFNTMNQLAHADVLSTDTALCIGPAVPRHRAGPGQPADAVQGRHRGRRAAVRPGLVLATIAAAAHRVVLGRADHAAAAVRPPRLRAAPTSSSLRYVIYGGSMVAERVARGLAAARRRRSCRATA